MPNHKWHHPAYIPGLKKYPTLWGLYEQGAIWFEKLPTGSTEVAGKAADGVQVNLGHVIDFSELKQVESYLVAHPTPDTW